MALGRPRGPRDPPDLQNPSKMMSQTLQNEAPDTENQRNFDEKVYQNLVFRIMGFEKRNIIKLILFESLIIFIPIILSSLIFSSIFSYFFVTSFFDIQWFFSIPITLLISSLFLSVFSMTLFISNKKYLNFNAYSLLRYG